MCCQLGRVRRSIVSESNDAMPVDADRGIQHRHLIPGDQRPVGVDRPEEGWVSQVLVVQEGGQLGRRVLSRDVDPDGLDTWIAR